MDGTTGGPNPLAIGTADVVLVRHGETTWSASGRHTGATDLALTENGRRQAEALGPLLAGVAFAAVWASPRRRALETAELAGLRPPDVLADLAEWDYGDYEGVTTADIRRDRPAWDLFTDGAPGGESPAEVVARADRVVRRLREADGPVLCVAHAHLLRVLAARWFGLDVTAAGRTTLDPASVSVLSTAPSGPALRRWNLVPTHHTV